MALNVDVLRSSFNLVVEREPEVVRRFYEILFERHPQSRALFRRNAPEVQQKMLTGALVAVLDHLDDAPWLVETLGALGAKHVEYGVTEEMYGWVGGSLLAALHDAAGSAWTPEIAGAWTEAYGAIQGLMLAGVARPTASA